MLRGACRGDLASGSPPQERLRRRAGLQRATWQLFRTRRVRRATRGVASWPSPCRRGSAASCAAHTLDGIATRDASDAAALARISRPRIAGREPEHSRSTTNRSSAPVFTPSCGVQRWRQSGTGPRSRRTTRFRTRREIHGPSLCSCAGGTEGAAGFAPNAVATSSVPVGSARAATNAIGYTAAPNVWATGSDKGDARSMRAL